MELRKVTAFCGSQGVGKSTIAKLISVFLWIEKSLMRGDFLPKEFENYDRFRKKYCAFHNIHRYFKVSTYIRFQGDKYTFEYQGGHLHIHDEGTPQVDYLRPQIIYVPAERNFMVAVEDAEKVRRLPNALMSMISDYVQALRASKGAIPLPIGGYSVQYDKLNKITWLTHEKVKVRVQEAASGFQSVVPLSVVSNHLLKKVLHEEDSKQVAADSSQEREHLQRTIQSLLRDTSLDDEVRRALILELNASIRNQRFINIVEEPEQNLFPSSQRHVLNELLHINNQIAGNKLVFTTHSPYILNYLTLAIKASMLWQKASEEQRERIGAIVPLTACIQGEEVVIYELSEEGNIEELPMFDSMPSDANYLNNALDETNRLFSALLDIEDEMEG